MVNIECRKLGNYNNKEILMYTLNRNDFTINILNLGATIQSICRTDKNNKLVNVVLGYNFFEKYIDNGAYAGAVVGRTSGRIEEGKYIIDYIEYRLPKNNGDNNLHGGIDGLSFKVFDVKEIKNGIELVYNSSHLEENYPGNVEFAIRYTIENDDVFNIEYFANSDRNTYINLTNHTYFNLSGNLRKNGLENKLKINSKYFVELNENLIPTGEFLTTKDTCFDMNEYLLLEEGIEKGHSQFNITKGYDHAFVLDRNCDINKLTEKKEKYKNGYEDVDISMYSEYSGIKLDISTDNNVVVVYSGNYLQDVPKFDSSYIDEYMGDEKGNNHKYLGIALETQDFQNAINNPNIKVEITNPSNPYYSKTKYRFSLI